MAMTLEKHLQFFTVLVLVTIVLLGYFVSAPLFVYLLFSNFWPIPAFYIAFLLLDRNIAKEGGRSISAIKYSRLWSYYSDYFPVKLIKTSELDPKHNYILGYHPHGIIGIAAVINFATNGTKFRELFPGIKSHCATLRLNFWLPVFRDFLLAFGMVSCSKKSIEYLCGKHASGNALALVVGGAAESYDAYPGSTALTLKNRKGFVRMAITTGAHLVPVYSFGETDIFRQIRSQPGSFLRAFQEHFHSVTGVVPCIFYGRGFLENSWGLFPLRSQVTTVVGSPIAVEQCCDPTEELVDRYHQLYIEQLTNLFEQHKDMSAYPDAKLIIK